MPATTAPMKRIRGAAPKAETPLDMATRLVAPPPLVPGADSDDTEEMSATRIANTLSCRALSVYKGFHGDRGIDPVLRRPTCKEGDS